MQAMEDSPKLTARQQQILDLVQSAIERTGAPPTRAEIAAGVPVRRASRCLLGGVVGAPADALPSAGTLTPVQARIEMMLDLLAATAA